MRYDNAISPDSSMAAQVGCASASDQAGETIERGASVQYLHCHFPTQPPVMQGEVNSQEIAMKQIHAAAIAVIFLTPIATAQAQKEPSAMDQTAILTTIETMTNAFSAGDT